MNSKDRRGSFFVKLGMSVGVLLLSLTQQAFAAGTAAGTAIDNLATVTYEVGNVLQDVVESAPGAGNAVPGAGAGTITTFVVDNRVDFSLTQVGATNTIVAPGQADAFVEFVLRNDGNSAQDFLMAILELGSGDGAVNATFTDTDVNLNNMRVRVGDSVLNGGAPPTTSSPDFVDELAPDDEVTIYVYGDADVILGLVNNDVANIELSAEVRAASGVVGGPVGGVVTDDVNNADTAGLEVVFAEGGLVIGDGIVTERDGFVLLTAGLTVSKVATVISDPFNGIGDGATIFPKAIPGAVVEYVITISNGGGADAQNVSISDAIDADVTFDSTFNGGAGVEVVNGGAAVPCVADGNAGDGCTLIGQDLTVGNGSLLITVIPTDALVVTYRVVIP